MRNRDEEVLFVLLSSKLRKARATVDALAHHPLFVVNH